MRFHYEEILLNVSTIILKLALQLLGKYLPGSMR